MKSLLALRPFVIAAILSLGAPLAHGDIVVNSTGDRGNGRALSTGVCDTDPFDNVSECTLRAAIQLANYNPDVTTITFNIPTSDPGYNAQTQSWTINVGATTGSPLPDLSTEMNINGPGASKLIVQAGATGIRIFNVTTTGSVSISGLTIASGGNTGLANTNGGTVNLSNCTVRNNDAGGIWNASGTMSINNCTVSDNVTFGGSGGGINNGGTMTVTSSTLRRNLASFGGGGIANSANLTMTKCTVADNRAIPFAQQPEVYGGGIVSSRALTLSNCIISGNSARGRDGQSGDPTAGDAFGGGIAVTNGTGTATLSMTNCTVFGNSAEGGNNPYRATAGGADGGGVAVGGPSNVSNSTIYGNSAISGYSSIAVRPSQGGGIYGSGTTLKSTLVATNSATTSGPDVFGSFVSRGFNLIGKKDGGTGFTAATDLKGTIKAPLDPKLGPLQNNGGPIQTMALQTGSPAIDKGTSVTIGGTTLTTDQRGTGFPRTVDKAVANATGGDGTDIGAYELQ
jgi:CSLREA domain-containing protein